MVYTCFSYGMSTNVSNKFDIIQQAADLAKDELSKLKNIALRPALDSNSCQNFLQKIELIDSIEDIFHLINGSRYRLMLAPIIFRYLGISKANKQKKLNLITYVLQNNTQANINDEDIYELEQLKKNFEHILQQTDTATIPTYTEPEEDILFEYKKAGGYSYLEAEFNLVKVASFCNLPRFAFCIPQQLIPKYKNNDTSDEIPRISTRKIENIKDSMRYITTYHMLKSININQAVLSYDIEMIAFLIKHCNADIRPTQDDGCSPLFRALNIDIYPKEKDFSQNKHKREVLRAWNKPLHLSFAYRNSVIFIAAYLINCMKEHPEDFNVIEQKSEFTPVGLAIRNYDPISLQLLLDAGASPTQAIKIEETYVLPYIYAEQLKQKLTIQGRTSLDQILELLR